MKNYFLKFASEAEAFAALQAEGATTTDEAGNEVLLTSHQNFVLDPVGILYKPTGNMLTDGEGTDYPEMAPLDGWHVNVRMIHGDLPESLQPFSVTPSSPMRVFA